MEPAVVVEELVVRYGDVTAVDGISLSARAGEITAVLGPNGAGKTSTIEVCEGFRRPTSGHVRVLGLDPAEDQRRLSQTMGVMLQEGGVYPSARPREMAELYCALHGRGVHPGGLLERVGLAERATTPWRRLSGGEKQRLSLALALAARPEVAFLDEPTSGVDVNGRAVIRDIVTGLAADGCAVVVATHELDEAERIADRVVVFDRGRVVADAPLEDLRGSSRRTILRTGSPVDPAALAAAVGIRVETVAPCEYVVDAADARTTAVVSSWLADLGVEVREMRVGGESLEDVFRRLTGGER